eukprot:TRINITY_DN30429_c0_g1_i2.p1 TRINITY_DN30429_c0_g1~~TRINITY_DN30429_c0_g1_i2.p1  ORF type:complete len:234 (+),score=30.43 TRINITY_DN30429_c0_g1_i2:290-991(+)
MPYLSVQLIGNDINRMMLQEMFGENMNVTFRNFVAGGAAGALAVATTYPLDTVRARLAMLSVKRAATTPVLVPQLGPFQMLRDIQAREGIGALYRGCWMSCMCCGVYCSIKFMTYDSVKARFCSFFGSRSDRELPAWQRGLGAAAGGTVALTFAYPGDVIRRRMQTSQGERPYRGLVHALTTIVREEGFRTGLYRGLMLNYVKTIPNVAINLTLYDVLKYWLVELRQGTPLPG